jgi:STAS-like domain of unknown function (DUF4325)
MALTFTLNDFGTTFATRERGAELREELLERAHEDDHVTVDFAGVTNVSYSFADEFMGKLCAETNMRVEMLNAAARVAEIAGRAVERRSENAVSC